jgi:hypothetical protein
MDAPFGNRHGMCRWIFLSAMAFCLAIITSSVSVHANGAGAGAAWLLEQQRDDGRISAGADETTPHHATFEATRALHPAHASSPVWTGAQGYLDRAAHSGIPWLPRRLLVSALAGDSEADHSADLLLRQNPDGGFAADPGDQSSLLDTVDGLEALGVAGLRDATVLQPAIRFVLDRQAAEGGFAYNHASPVSPYLTARVITALQRYQFEFGLSGALRAASDFLWSELERTGPEASWQKAQALLALMPITPDPGRYQDALNHLRAAQAQDGSWDGSVYSTALALRALQVAAAAGGLPDRGSSAVGGRLVDTVGEAPVAEASVTLEGATGSRTMKSGSDGRFLLADLDPGTYVLRVTAMGFRTLSRDLELSPGLLLDLGAVSIALEPDTALIAGTVTDAQTGQGLGAAITLIGETGGSVTAAADGAYVFPVPAGELLLSASAAGYQEVRASAVVAPGDRLVFSPALSRDFPTDPDAPVEVTGRLVDANSLQPIPGAAVRVTTTGGIAVSDAEGVFGLAGLSAGEIHLELVHASYRTALVSFLATPGGRIELGELLLQPLEGAGTTVRGQVVDAYTGNPVEGAQVVIGDQVADTDGLGHYQFKHIQDLSFEVRAGAAGFRSASRHLALQQPGLVHLDFALERAGLEGIHIAGILAHTETVGAFEEARFTVALENRGAEDRQVILSATVEGVTSVFQEDFLIPLPHGNRAGVFLMASGEVVLREFGWFTRHLAPGLYRVRAQAWSADGTTLLADAAVMITVTETVTVASLGLLAEPREAVRSESAEVMLAAVIRNASNVTSVLEFSLVMRDPLGATIHEQEVRLELPPSAATLNFDLGAFEHRFEHAGAYSMELQALSGLPVHSLHAGHIVVAPNIRIEGSHGVEPPQILPLEDARVQIRFTIEGMEDGR